MKTEEDREEVTSCMVSRALPLFRYGDDDAHENHQLYVHLLPDGCPPHSSAARRGRKTWLDQRTERAAYEREGRTRHRITKKKKRDE